MNVSIMADEPVRGPDVGTAKRLRRLRAMLGLTQAQMAARCGIKTSTYGLLENGWPLARENALRIKRAVPGIDLDYLFEGETWGVRADLLLHLRDG